MELTGFDQTARWSYDQFRLAQPHIEVDGLWKGDHFYVIKTRQDSTDLKARDGTPIAEWFKESHPIHIHMVLMLNPPAGLVLLPERTPDEVSDAVGFPRTRPDLWLDINLELPKDFPPFTFQWDGRSFRVQTTRELSAAEAAQLLSIVQKHFPDAQSLSREVVPNEIDVHQVLAGTPPITLLPLRARPGALSGALYRLTEEDEDLWLSRGSKALRGEVVDLPSDRFSGGGQSKCFINMSMDRSYDIRNHLTLYKQIYVALPRLQNRQELMDSHGATPAELVKLIEMGRLKLVLTHDPSSYDIDLLSQAADTSPQSIVMPRELATAVMAADHSVFPFLNIGIPTAEKQLLLQVLNECAVDPELAKKLPNHGKVIAAFSTGLSEAWQRLDEAVRRRGVIGLSVAGVSQLADALLRVAMPDSKLIELMATTPTVQIAHALHASAFETRSEWMAPWLGYSASLYTGLRVARDKYYATNLETILTDVLAVDGKVPVLDLARNFSGDGDIERFRDLVTAMTRASASPEEFAQVVEDFNKAVTRFEKTRKYLNHVDLSGLLASLVVDPVVSHGGWLAMVLVNAMYRSPRVAQSPLYGGLADLVRGLGTMSNPNVVLVSRIKQSIHKTGESD